MLKEKGKREDEEQEVKKTKNIYRKTRLTNCKASLNYFTIQCLE